ncbi:unnamed protein product, partial [Meganyctiphanes norvegica]
MATDSSAAMKNAFENNENQSNIISVELGGTDSSSFPFVKYLKNLVHLDLSFANLHGKLDNLKHIHRGLWLLNLNKCSLNNADLAQLMDSCHQETLKELNLSGNDFTYNNCNNLIRLCQNLSKVRLLMLNYCRLESW